MIEVTKQKFDPIALPGQPGYPTSGPRIGEPVPAPPPKATSGSVPGNKPESPAAAPPAPAPAWVKEAIGRLFVPTRGKAAVLVAGLALGGGMYAAKLFTAPPESPTATAVLEVAKPEPAPPNPNATIQPPAPGNLPPAPPPNSFASAPSPVLTFDNIPVLSTPTEAERFRGRDTSPAVPNIDLTRSASAPVPDLTFPTVPAPALPAPVGVNNVPSLEVPPIPNFTAGTIRPVESTAPATGGSGVGGNSVVVPAITGLTSPTIPASNAGPPTVPSIDIPNIGGGGIGGGSTGTVPPVPVIPNHSPVTTNPTPPAPRLPDLTGTGGGSIGSGAALPGPLPSMTSPTSGGGFEPTRSPVPPAPVPTAPREPDTSFDEDVHTVKQGDSYASISKTYYGDAAFANALQMYEESRTGRTAGTVHVPPIAILRKRFPQAIRGEAPVTPAATVPAERTTTVSTGTGSGTDWNAARAGTRTKSYTLSRAMTMRDIAKEAFGSEFDWTRVWDLNLNLSTDAALPQGTKVALPPDAKVGQ